MARSRVLTPSSLVAFLFVFVAIACGGRTGDTLGGGLIASGGGGFPDGSGGVTPGVGGTPGNGGQRATGGKGGYSGYGASGGYGAYPGYGGYAAYPGYGGYAQGAYPGYGGYAQGAYPGYGGYGAYPGSCTLPTCQCSDCVSQCECQGIPNQGIPSNYCYDSCYGTGGFGGQGQGGGPVGCSYPTCQYCPDCLSRCTCSGADFNSCYSDCYGTGGAGGTTGCDPSFCPAPGGGLPLASCCAPDGSCGVSTDPVAAILRVQGGCQSYNQPGYPNPQCQPVASPLGTLAGCCRPDGTCGTDLGIFGLGCVQSNNGGNGISYCGPLPPPPPPPGTGGAPNTADGGSSIAACVMNAHSDCERCACQNCGDSLGPCFQDVGCPLILQCANQTGCTGVDCYNANTCQAIIDQYGGIGSRSVSLAIPLFQCARTCGCGFAPP